MPGFHVHQQLLKCIQIHVHWVGDTIQPSHPLSSSLQSFLASGSFQWVSSSHEVAEALEFQLQHQSFQWIPRTHLLSRTSLMAQTVKRLFTMWETWVWALGWEYPLEKEMAIHSSTNAWKIPWTEEPGRLQSMGSRRVRHNWATSLLLFIFMHWLRWLSVCLQCGRPGFSPSVGKIPWRRKWQSTLVLLPGKSHGQRSLVGYSPWGRKESDMTERLHFTSFLVLS